MGHRRAVALRGALVASVAVLLALPAAGPSAASPSAPTAGGCADATGVTVVVDFGSLGGGVKVRCALWPVSSGLDALRKAGFEPVGTQRFPGLLCRIDGKPNADQDPCFNAPAQDAYWAYWHGPRGGGWTYSSSGAGSYKPAKGSVEGWAFGDSAKPSVGPPAPSPVTTTTRPRPSTSTTVPATGTPTTASPSGPTTTAPDDGSPSTTAAAAGASATTVDTASEEEGSTSTSASDDEVATAASDSSSPSDPDGGGGGSPVGVLVAVVAVGALGATAWVRSRRRGPGAV